MNSYFNTRLPEYFREFLEELNRFEYAYARAKTMKVDELSVRVVDLDDLILLKHAAVKERNKARDSEDLSYLQKLKAAQAKKKKT